MNKREFDALLRSCTVKGAIDTNKIEKLENAAKDEMVRYIVRNRGPILKELITVGTDMQWLECCGYLYETKGKSYTFVHTCEHKTV